MGQCKPGAWVVELEGNGDFYSDVLRVAVKLNEKLTVGSNVMFLWASRAIPCHAKTRELASTDRHPSQLTSGPEVILMGCDKLALAHFIMVNRPGNERMQLLVRLIEAVMSLQASLTLLGYCTLNIALWLETE